MKGKIYIYIYQMHEISFFVNKCMKYLNKMTNTSLILWDLQKDAYNA